MGYGAEDCHLKARLCLDRGLTPQRVSNGFLGAIRHSNALRGQNFKEPIGETILKNHKLLLEYYRSKGITDISKDPIAFELIFRPESAA